MSTEEDKTACVPNGCISNAAALKHISLEVEPGALENFRAETDKKIKLLLGAVACLAVLSLALLIVVVLLGNDVRANHRAIDDLESYRDSEIGQAGTADGVVLTTGPQTVDGYSAQGSLFEGSGFWATKHSLPDGGRSDFQVVSDGGDMLYIIGGLGTDNAVLDTVWAYDTLLDKYTDLAALPSPRYRFGATYMSGELYVVGGFERVDGDQLSTAFAFNIENQTWRSLSNTLEPHGDTCAAVVGDKVYVVAGYGANYNTLNSVEAYDKQADTWSYVAPLPEPRGDVSCAAVDNVLYAVGGYYDSSGTWAADSFHNSLFSYAPGTNKWTQKKDMPTARGDKAVSALSNNRLVVVGGETHARNAVTQIPVHSVEVYHADLDVWEAKAQIPTARFRFGLATARDDLVYAFGGHLLCTSDCHATALDSLEVYFDLKHPSVFIHTKA